MTVVLEIGRSHLHARSGRAEGGIAERHHHAPIPGDIDRSDARAMGTWLRAELGAAGFPRGRVTLALPRGEVVLKLLDLPTDDLGELPEMVRMALVRELPFEAHDAVIDFAIRDRSSGAGDGVGAEAGRRTQVLAVAAPAARLRHLTEIVKLAGGTAARIALRAEGMSALVVEGTPRAPDAMDLLLDLTGDVAEMSFVDSGMAFVRAGERLDGDDPSAIAPRLAADVQRTLATAPEGVGAPNRLLLFGSDTIVASARAELAGLAIDVHRVPSPPGATPSALDGLLLPKGAARAIIDLAHPTQPPDRAAARRFRVIVGAGLAVLLLLAGWTVVRKHAASQIAELDGIQQRRDALAPTFARLRREQFRLRHLDRWESAGPDWLAEIMALDAIVDASPGTVVDGLHGSSRFQGVEYDRRKSAWAHESGITFVLDGEGKDRLVADELRAAFVASDDYRVSSSGSDAATGRRLPVGFTYRIDRDRKVAAPPAETEGPS